MKIKPYPELHQQGFFSVDKSISSSLDCDFGIQIADDGRVWVCVDGQSFIRFKPKFKETVKRFDLNNAIQKYRKLSEATSIESESMQYAQISAWLLELDHKRKG